MAPNNLTLFFPAMIALLLTPPLLAVSSTAPPPAKGCSDEIVSFSPCLPYVSSSPNNSSSSPSIQCCDVFSSAFDTGDADCLCYLSRRPLLLGFPVNSTRLFSLSSLCPPKNAESQTRGSLQSICSGSLKLPPLLSIIGPGIPRHHDSGGDNSTPPSMTSPPPQSADTSSSPAKPSSSPAPASPSSSAAKRINNRYSWFSLGLMVLLLPIFTSH